MIKSPGIFVMAVILPAIAPASIIFTNLGASQSYDITQGNPVGNDFAGDNAAQGDTFTPTVNATLSSIELALSCVVSCPASESFTVALTANNSDAPGAVIESFLFVGKTLGALGNNNPLITMTSVLHPSLTAGTQYWVTVSSTVNFAIAWNDSSTGDTSDEAISSDGGASWFSPSGMTPSAYQVDGTNRAPEPSTMVLFGSALVLSVAVYGRRSRPRE